MFDERDTFHEVLLMLKTGWRPVSNARWH